MNDKVGLISRSQKIDAIRRLPNELATAIEGLNEDQLDIPYRDGGWNSRQIVHHIADSHMNAFIRMKLLLSEDHPTFKPYDQDSWAAAPDYKENICSSVSIISGLHQRMADVFEHATDADWSRTAYHPERGEMM